MKKIMMICLCALLVGGLSGCSSNQAPTDDDQLANLGGNVEMDGDVEITNPIKGFETLAEAGAEAGFELVLADEDFKSGYETAITVINQEMIQVKYSSETSNVIIRKGLGNGDISGVFSSFDKEEVVDVEGVAVTFKSNEGKVYVANWQNNDYNYAISVSEGMNQADVEAIIAMID